jgi:hypothetical protein
MAQKIRMAWNANRHWVAVGFLASTCLFVLLMFVNWRDQRRGIAAQKATGLASIAWEPTSMWQHQNILPSFLAKQKTRSVDHLAGTLGGVPIGVPREAADASPADHIDPQVIRTGTLEIIATDPSQAAEELRNLATHLSGFAVSLKVSGSDEGTRSAQITMRIPAGHFDEARAQVRTIAKAVEQDTVEVRDVTREYVNQEASLRNSRAEEAQYFTILKRATAIKDVLEISSKLAEVRGSIDEREADLRFLHHQVEMALLTTNITGVAETQVFGIHWRPLYEVKLSLRGALSAIADYTNSMVALFLNLPVIAMWGFTIVGLLKVGWLILRRIVLLFFPGLAVWLRRPAQPQAT